MESITEEALERSVAPSRRGLPMNFGLIGQKYFPFLFRERGFFQIDGKLMGRFNGFRGFWIDRSRDLIVLREMYSLSQIELDFLSPFDFSGLRTQLGGFQPILGTQYVAIPSIQGFALVLGSSEVFCFQTDGVVWTA